MVGSTYAREDGLEKDDLRGYFIIEGNCKTVVMQEKAAYKITVYKKNSKQSKYEAWSELRSISDTSHFSTEEKFSTKLDVGIFNEKIYTRGPFSSASTKVYYPITVIYKILGIKSEDKIKIAYYIFGSKVNKNDPKFTQSEDWSEEEKRMVEILTNTLEEDEAYIGNEGELNEIKEKDKWKPEHIFPHLGTNNLAKIFFLSYIIYRVLLVHCKVKIDNKRRYEVDDRDDFMNKRILSQGSALMQQFSTLFKTFGKNLQEKFSEKKNQTTIIPILSSLINGESITIGMMDCIKSSKKWKVGGKKQSYSRTQDLIPLNEADAIATLRKTVIPSSQNSGKILEPRELHPSHIGVVDPAETPEGKKTGLIKFFSMTTYCSLGTDHTIFIVFFEKKEDFITFVEMEERLREYGNLIHSTYKIFINNNWIGNVREGKKYVDELKKLRRNGDIHFEISITLDDEKKTLTVMTEAGRLMSPKFIVENGKLLFQKSHLKEIMENDYSWTKILQMGIIEMIDKEEENNCIYSDFSKNIKEYTTHCDIHPSLMFGYSTSSVIYPHHSQSPRLSYQAGMHKQTMNEKLGILSPNDHHILMYPQKKIMSSMLYFAGHGKEQLNTNVTIAILPYGLNQEDSIIMNKAARDRGLFMSTEVHSYISELPNNSFYVGYVSKEAKECSGNVRTVKGFKGNNRFLVKKNEKEDSLDEIKKGDGNYLIKRIRGVAKLRSRLEKNDIIIGILQKSNFNEEKNDYDVSCCSILYEHNLPGYVQEIKILENGSIQVEVTQLRLINEGDKVSSTISQKSTISQLKQEADMPFFDDGTVPDIIMNPCSQPSRMTIGMLIEMLGGMAICSTKMSTISDKEKLLKYLEEIKNSRYSSVKKELNDYVSDATPFEEKSIDIMGKMLLEAGISNVGLRNMTCGETGERYKQKVFTGICSYQKLKHLADKKCYAKGYSGPVSKLTNQPLEGRSVKGGLRYGTMEKDSTLGQGGRNVLEDRLSKSSDYKEMYSCSIHGIMTRNCKACNGTQNIEKIKMPMATSLLIDQAAAMGFGMLVYPRDKNFKN